MSIRERVGSRMAVGALKKKVKKELGQRKRNEAGNIPLALTPEQKTLAAAQLARIAGAESVDVDQLARNSGFTEAVTFAVRAAQAGFDENIVERLFAQAAKKGHLVPTRGEQFVDSFKNDFAEGTKEVGSTVATALTEAAGAAAGIAVTAAIKGLLKK